MPLELTGLTAAEVADRLRRGLGNRTPRSGLRDYFAILARNTLTGFNAMVVPAAVVLFSLGDLRAALAVSGMAIVNTLLSLVQEIRAKVHLDRLSLMTESQVHVCRDGETVAIAAGDVVEGDCVLLRAGDTVVADGPVLQSQFLEIDEALLSGESDPVRRGVGESILSGSTCVAGAGAYRAAGVGPNSFAQKTAAAARQYHVASSPLTRSINRIVRLLSYTALALCGMHLIGWWALGVSADDAVRRVAATITTMVPQGLVLAATISFIVGAVALGRRGVLVQQLSAIETMASIDVICTDKTGTLTTNKLTLEFVHGLGAIPDNNAIPNNNATLDIVAIRQALGWFASASVDRDNRNIGAIRQAVGTVAVQLLDQIPFKSSLRYSALRVVHDGVPRLFVLGAIESLRQRSSVLDGSFDELVRSSQERGLRLLLFAEADGKTSLTDAAELPDVPLRPLALLGLADELRPGASAVLEALAVQGIDFKVISGDNPQTVQGTVRHLHLPMARDAVVSGDELARSPHTAQLIRERGVFGRIAPQQKVTIVESLKADGRRVAMIGDGVNDVLPIKHADLGIAMGSGSAASKRVAGLVLQEDRFELLPETLEEGRTIVRNIRRSAKLFLVKNVYSFILIVASYAGLGLPFPYVPQQVTLLNWSVIGIPGLAIAFSRQRAKRVSKRPFVAETLSFAIRTGVIFGLGGVAILWHGIHLYPGDERLVRTMFLSMLILLGITTLFRALTDGEPAAETNDAGFRLLGLLALPIYLTAMYFEPARRFFEMAPLGGAEWSIVLGYAVVCWLATLASDRWLASGNVPLESMSSSKNI
jgi:cation-transporting ATPase E